MIRGAWWLALLVAALGPTAAGSEERPIVAVFDVENQGSSLDGKTIDRLTNYLCSLVAGKGYQVVPRADLKRRLVEKKQESYRQCYDQSCQIEIGQELSAQKSLATQIILLGGRCKVALSLFDLKRAASEKGLAVSGGCTEAEIVDSLERAVAAMTGAAVLPQDGKPPADLTEYERLAAEAGAADRKAQEDRKLYLESLEKAWDSVKKVAATKAMTTAARAGIVRKFLEDFARENPHEAEARAWVAKLDQGLEALGEQGMVKIPAGDFMMGCSPKDYDCVGHVEDPAHNVTVSEFWMDETEVTVAAYRKCLEAGKCTAPSESPFCNWNKPGRDGHPVNCVRWEQARDYCEWAGKRLPTEAEWEKAARGGTTTARYGEMDEVCWHSNNASGSTHEVGKKKPNAFGLYDMLGNVAEWCADAYQFNYYQSSPAKDPKGPGSEDGEGRVIRGGYFSDTKNTMRVSERQNHLNDFAVGFRCARNASQP